MIEDTFSAAVQTHKWERMLKILSFSNSKQEVLFPKPNWGVLVAKFKQRMSVNKMLVATQHASAPYVWNLLYWRVHRW